MKMKFKAYQIVGGVTIPVLERDMQDPVDREQIHAAEAAAEAAAENRDEPVHWVIE